MALKTKTKATTAALAALALGGLLLLPAAAQAAGQTTTIPVSERPAQVAVSPDGSRAYVSSRDDAVLTTLDTSTDEILSTVPGVVRAGEVVVSPDGSTLYLLEFVESTVAFYDVASQTVTARVPIGVDLPAGLLLSPDGRTLYTSGQTPDLAGPRGLVVAIDVAQQAVVRTAAVAVDNVTALALGPDGQTLFATISVDDVLAVVDAGDLSVEELIPVGESPGRLAVSPDGARVYVVNYGDPFRQVDRSLTVVDVAASATTATLTFADRPGDVGVSPDGSILYVLADQPGAVLAVDSTTFAVRDRTPVGVSPSDIAVTPGGTAVYVPNYTSDTLSVIRWTAPTITAAAPPAATVGAAYSYAFAASGTPTPAFEVTAGALPEGLVLGRDGLLSGTPTSEGTATFTVSAVNGTDPADAAAALTITVAPAPPAPPVFTAAAPPVSATVGTAYSYVFTASGVPAPTFSVSSGSLPAGLVLSADGTLGGVPTTAGSSTFTVTASNGSGPAAATAPITVTVADVVLPAPVVTSPADGATVSSDVTYRGTGTPGASVALVTTEGDQLPQSSGPAEDAVAAAAASADPIVVAADGTWSRTVAVAPGRYTTVAVQFLAAGGAVTTSSPGSAPVRYAVAAAAAVPSGTAGGGRTAGLASTGSDTAVASAVAGGLLAAAGLGLVLAARRRRSVRVASDGRS